MKQYLLILFVLPALVLASGAYAQAAATCTITWTDNSNNEDGFKIERKLGTTGTFAEVGRVGANVTTYADPNLAHAQQYCYRLRAYNTVGDSPYSNEACITTTANPLPAAPTNLKVVAQ